MRKGISLILLLLSLLSVEAKGRKAVFIIIDGVPADVIPRVNTPNIDEISSLGGYSEAETGGLIGGYSQTPTISAVGYNNLITATWVNKHNVPNNDISDPNYNYWSIFRLAKEQKRDFKTALFSSWTDNRTKLIGEGLEATNNLKIDYVFDGLDLDNVNYPKEKNGLHIFKIDEQVAKEAAKCIIKDSPDVMWVYLWYMDDAGHIFGTNEYFDEYLEKADRQVGYIWDAVKKRMEGNDEQWMIVVTSDHGRNHPDGHHHGGQSERERSIWISTNVKPNNYFTQEPLVDITDIIPSVARFIGMDAPKELMYEWDGVPLVGDVDIANLKAERQGDRIVLNWDSFSNSKMKIYLSVTNNFKNGAKDTYQKIGYAKASDREFIYDCGKNPSEFYKFVVEGRNNTLNVWVVSKK